MLTAIEKILFALAFCCAQAVMAQDILGDWYGMVKMGGMPLRLSVNFSKNDTGYSGKMISIDQGNSVLPLAYVRLEGTSLRVKTTVAGVEYEGTLKDQALEGYLTQNGAKFPLSFGRQRIEKPEMKRLHRRKMRKRKQKTRLSSNESHGK